MDAEEICVSLETAKRLHEAGIKVDSYFHWVGSKFSARKPMLTFNNIMPEAFTYCEQYRAGLFKYPALQAEELKDWLASNRKLDKKEGKEVCRLICIPTDTKWKVCYMSNNGVIAGGVGEIIENEMLCEALAELALKEAGCELNKFDK